MSSDSRKLIFQAMAVALSTALMIPQVSFGEPPPHAKAHGWRKKNDPTYVGYTGKQWERDYGVIEGRCNREAVGAVVGGAIGGAIGSTVGQGDTRAVAIVAGTVLGAVIGSQIAREIDDADRGCMGHALELAPEGKAVSWSNTRTGVTYVVTPLKGYKSGAAGCREFKTVVKSNGKSKAVTDKACRSSDGTWRMVS